MGYQNISKKIKFNINKNIGSVLYIVEGERREINLLGHIFRDILNYDEIIGIDRNGNERIKYVNKQNENSKIFIINSAKSNVNSITDTDFIDKQVEILRKYDEEFNYEDVPIYYIFDCDRKQDKANISRLIELFNNAREASSKSQENMYDSIGGMILLSYPCIESFIISNFEKDLFKFNEKFDFQNQTLKKYIDLNHYDDHKMSINTLINAFNELVESLNKINIKEINLDDTTKFNTDIFIYEQNNNNQYLLSLLLISFIDLGIIEIDA